MKTTPPRRVVLVATLPFLLIPSSRVEADVRWLHPLLQGNHLHDVEFLDESTAIAVGDVGTVMVTYDAGQTWGVSAKTAGVLWPLTCVTRLNATTAIAGGGGVFLKTTTAGSTWSPITDIAGGQLDVDFLGNAGLATLAGSVGEPDRLRLSTDGGETWVTVYEAFISSDQVNAVDVVTDMVMVAAGAIFLRSTDGGLTWAELPFDPGLTSAVSVSFIDPLHGGVIAGDLLHVTSDGGASWAQIALDPVYSESANTGTELEMLDEQSFLVSAVHTGCSTYTSLCSSMGQFLRTENGGASWDSEWATRPLRGLTRNAAGVVLLVGDAGTICRWTEAGGIEQVAGSLYGATDEGGYCAFVDPAHGVVVGVEAPMSMLSAASTVLRTSDGGETWNSIKLPTTHLTDVTATPGATYATGSRLVNGSAHNTLLKSSDGGASWTALWSASATYGSTEPQAIAFASEPFGMAVGKRSTLLIIDHDAVTAGAPLTFPPQDFWDVSLADETTAVAVGGGPPLICRTTNGGASWTRINSHPMGQGPLFAVAFASPQVCVVGGRGAWYRSEDSGATWTHVLVTGPFANPEIWAFAFGSPTYGVAVGSLAGVGVAYETTDAGRTWTVLDMPTGSRLTDVSCFSPYQTIVSGRGLEVLEYTIQPVPTMISSFAAFGEPFAALLRWTVPDESALSHFEVQRRQGALRQKVASNLPATTRSFRDAEVATETSYEYTLVAVDHDGYTVHSAPLSVTIPGAALELLPNHPNPFNPSTTVRFVVPVRGHVRLAVYDVSGHHVVTLVDGIHEAGLHAAEWDGTNARGEPAASGVYVSRLEAGKQTVTRKLVLVK